MMGVPSKKLLPNSLIASTVVVWKLDRRLALGRGAAWRLASYHSAPRHQVPPLPAWRHRPPKGGAAGSAEEMVGVKPREPVYCLD